MKINTNQEFTNEILLQKLSQAGYELTNNLDEADNYIPGIVVFSNGLNNYLKQNKPAKALELKLELATKNGLLDAIKEVGLDEVKTVKEASLENIQNFNDPFIIKPNTGFSASSQYNFVYKPFRDYNEFISSVNLEEFTTNFIDTGAYTNYIIQKSLLDENNEINQIFISGFVNPNLEMYIECYNDVTMIEDARADSLSNSQSAYPSKFIRVGNTYCDPTNINDEVGILNDLDRLFKFYIIKRIRFQCHAITNPT